MILETLALGTLAYTTFIGLQIKKIKDAKSAKEKFFMYDDLFQLHSLINRVPEWRWLKAIAKQESDLGQNSLVKNGEVSYDGKSYGLMQIAEGLGSPKEIELKGKGGKTALNDPNYSIEKAAKLVGYLWNKYQNSYKVFLAYNQGEKNTDKGANYTHPNGQYADLILKHLKWIDAKEKEYSK